MPLSFSHLFVLWVLSHKRQGRKILFGFQTNRLLSDGFAQGSQDSLSWQDENQQRGDGSCKRRGVVHRPWE